MNRINPSFDSYLLSNCSWIDVRAPIEFEIGTIPKAVNLPLLNNNERHLVGTTYKQLGREAAIRLGHELISGDVKQARLASWQEHIEKNPNSIIFCYRGGLRSQITQQWLKEAGVNVPIVEGGYKVLRHFILDLIANLIPQMNFEIVCGPTGSGKTKFLYDSGRPFLDLEKIANHRGSAFGSYESPQPHQANFENTMALEILRLSKENSKATILLESESRMIGRCVVPDSLISKIKNCKKIEIDLPLERRVENIFVDYILQSRLGLQSDVTRFEDFRKAIKSISRRLGGMRAQEILNDIHFAEKDFVANGSLESNRVWIQKLLVWYYDPLYKKE
jgi:tRNA 2-selenouridine synthase